MKLWYLKLTLVFIVKTMENLRSARIPTGRKKSIVKFIDGLSKSENEVWDLASKIISSRNETLFNIDLALFLWQFCIQGKNHILRKLFSKIFNPGKTCSRKMRSRDFRSGKTHISMNNTTVYLLSYKISLVIVKL